MTMPREIALKLDGVPVFSKTNIDNCVLAGMKKYYSQAVIDEKDARIKQLETTLQDMERYLDKGDDRKIISGSGFHRSIKQALASKQGEK